MSWFDGVDAAALTGIAAKGWDKLEGDAAAKAIFSSYSGLEKLHGQSSSADYVKLADFTSQDATVSKAAWAKLGVPENAGAYSLDGMKFKDGSGFDSAFVEAARAAGLAAGLTKAQLEKFVGGMMPYMEASEAADVAAAQTTRQSNEAELNGLWAEKAMANKYIANRAMDAVKSATGIDWSDALKALEGAPGGGYSKVMQLFKHLGDMMGEGRFIPAGDTQTGRAFTAEQARQRLDSLMADDSWRARVVAGDIGALKERADLHAIIARDMIGQAR